MEGPKGREQPPAVPAPPGQNRDPPGGWVGGTAQRPPAASGGGDSPLLRSPPRCHPREGRTPTRPQVAPVSRGGVVVGGGRRGPVRAEPPPQPGPAPQKLSVGSGRSAGAPGPEPGFRELKTGRPRSYGQRLPVVRGGAGRCPAPRPCPPGLHLRWAARGNRRGTAVVVAPVRRRPLPLPGGKRPGRVRCAGP